MFPDAEDETLKASFLKPFGVTPETLCKRRIRTMGFVIGVLFAKAFFLKGGFFWQFTWWTFLSMWGTYTILALSHILNGDMKKQTYTQPAKIDTTKMPYKMCYIAIVMYEW